MFLTVPLVQFCSHVHIPPIQHLSNRSGVAEWLGGAESSNGPGFEPSAKGGVSSKLPTLVFCICAYIGATSAWGSSCIASISFHSHIDDNKVLKICGARGPGLSPPCSPGIRFRTVPHRVKTSYLRSSQSLDVRYP